MLPGSTKPRFTAIDAAILAALAAGIAYVFFQVGVVLNYQWKWDALPRFFLRYDEARHAFVPNLLLLGILTTLRLSLWGSLVGLVIGLAVGLMRVSPNMGLRLIAAAYVETIRNIPPLVFIFIFFFFLASQLIPMTGIVPAVRRASPEVLAVIDLLFGEPRQLTQFLAAAVALGLFGASYVAEILRAGIEAVGKGQWEAAEALGLRRGAALRHIILPQALAKIWPPLANEVILLIKFSSLASLVSVPDLTFQAGQVGVTTRGMFEVWLLVAAIYFVICYGLAQLFSALERRSNRHLQR
jgi:polar amino acid transport system permease protein